MRAATILSTALIFSLPEIALSQDACRSGVSDLFLVHDYDVAEDTSGYMAGVRIEVTLLNSGDKGVRMVDGSIIFQDVLNRDILRIAIDPDLRVEAGGMAHQDGLYSNIRLLDVDPEDVIASTCIRGLVYSDGEVFKVDD